MEITLELPDEQVGSAIEEWMGNHLDDLIETWMEGNSTTDVEGAIRGLLDDFTPGEGGCGTARSFEQAVNSIMDHRGEIVIKQNVDGITGEVRDALAEMVAKEVETQVSVMIVNIQRGLRGLHERNPEVAGSI